MLNTEFEILVKVLVKRLVLVFGCLVGEVQTCAIQSNSIHDKLHLL